MQYESPVMEVTIYKKRVIVSISTQGGLVDGDGSDDEFGGDIW